MITALICARNEEKRIGHILDVMKDHPFIGEIIVAVDGDTRDKTLTIAGKYTDMIIPPTANIKGKGQLITAALKRFRTNAFVMLSDADYRGMRREHITIMGATLPAQEMKIGVPEFPVDVPERVISSWPWVSGIRVVPIELLKYQSFIGYLTEVQINQAAAKARYRFRFKFLPGLHSDYDMNPRRIEEMERDRAVGLAAGILGRNVPR